MYFSKDPWALPALLHLAANSDARM